MSGLLTFPSISPGGKTTTDVGELTWLGGSAWALAIEEETNRPVQTTHPSCFMGSLYSLFNPRVLRGSRLCVRFDFSQFTKLSHFGLDSRVSFGLSVPSFISSQLTYGPICGDFPPLR